MEFNSNASINSTALAAVLGLTARRVTQLVQDGVFVSSGRGKYPLAESVQRYIEFKTRGKESAATEADKLDAETRIKTAKAGIAELELAELEGVMHRAEDVEAMTEDLVFAIRAALIALPGRLAVDVCGAETPVIASELIRAEVHRAMEELSQYQYDPKKYEERVRERRKWDTRETEAEREAD